MTTETPTAPEPKTTPETPLADPAAKAPETPKQPETPAKATESVVPEKYDLKLPKDSLLDAKDVDAIADFAKANKLPANVAQAILEQKHADREAYVEGQRKMLEDESNKWLEEVKADKEIGGANAAKNIELAKRMAVKFGPEGFEKELDESRLGNHPMFVKMMVRLLKAANFAEDTLVVSGAPPAPPAKDGAKAMYPNMAKQLGRE